MSFCDHWYVHRGIRSGAQARACWCFCPCVLSFACRCTRCIPQGQILYTEHDCVILRRLRETIQRKLPAWPTVCIQLIGNDNNNIQQQSLLPNLPIHLILKVGLLVAAVDPSLSSVVHLQMCKYQFLERNVCNWWSGSYLETLVKIILCTCCRYITVEHYARAQQNGLSGFQLCLV